MDPQVIWVRVESAACPSSIDDGPALQMRFVPMTRSVLLPLALVLCAGSSWAQDDPQEESQRSVKLTVAPLSMQRNVAGRWATVSVNAANLGDEDVEETVAVTVGDGSKLQYARRLWVPAGARRQAWLPIQIPSDLLPNDQHIELNSMRLDETASGEQFKRNVVGSPITQRSLLLSREQSRAAVLVDSFKR